MTDIKDLDNIIHKYIREIRPINIKKVNEDIKKIKFDNMVILGCQERILIYAYKSYERSTSYSALLINCCNKCGNFNSIKDKTDKILCKC